mmetsp:Transcript_4237/g.15581  ORF Transcript_4237/g.15581 Transcript_4237/m.15581 type:complete len:167 (+) Transcript_4237:706-1206(+)
MQAQGRAQVYRGGGRGSFTVWSLCGADVVLSRKERQEKGKRKGRGSLGRRGSVRPQPTICCIGQERFQPVCMFYKYKEKIQTPQKVSEVANKQPQDHYSANSLPVHQSTKTCLPAIIICPAFSPHAITSSGLLTVRVLYTGIAASPPRNSTMVDERCLRSSWHGLS